MHISTLNMVYRNIMKLYIIIIWQKQFGFVRTEFVEVNFAGSMDIYKSKPKKVDQVS